MKRAHLNELALIIGAFRDQLAPLEYSSLMHDLSDLCGRANPAFDPIRFREMALQAPLRSGQQAATAVNPLTLKDIRK